jgi:hypothetical protein
MAKPAPDSKLWTVAEAADVFGVEPGMLQRAMDRGLDKTLHAFQEKDGAWVIPARGIKAMLGFQPVQLLSIGRVAELLDASYHHVFRRLKALGLVIEIPDLGIQRVKLPALTKLING